MKTSIHKATPAAITALLLAATAVAGSAAGVASLWTDGAHKRVYYGFEADEHYAGYRVELFSGAGDRVRVHHGRDDGSGRASGVFKALPSGTHDYEVHLSLRYTHGGSWELVDSRASSTY